MLVGLWSLFLVDIMIFFYWQFLRLGICHHLYNFINGSYFKVRIRTDEIGYRFFLHNWYLLYEMRARKDVYFVFSQSDVLIRLEYKNKCYQSRWVNEHITWIKYCNVAHLSHTMFRYPMTIHGNNRSNFLLL